MEQRHQALWVQVFPTISERLSGLGTAWGHWEAGVAMPRPLHLGAGVGALRPFAAGFEGSRPARESQLSLKELFCLKSFVWLLVPALPATKEPRHLPGRHRNMAWDQWSGGGG